MANPKNYITLEALIDKLNEDIAVNDHANIDIHYRIISDMLNDVIDNPISSADEVSMCRSIHSKITAARYYEPIDYVESKVETINADNNRIAAHALKAVYVIELICRPKDRAALIGDLLEAYDDVLEKYGERQAKTWLRVQVFWTVLHCLKSRLQSVGMAAIGAAFVWMARKIGF